MNKVTTGYCLPKEVKEWLAALAESEGRSASGMLTAILKSVMEGKRP